MKKKTAQKLSNQVQRIVSSDSTKLPVFTMKLGDGVMIDSETGEEIKITNITLEQKEQYKMQNTVNLAHYRAKKLNHC